MSNILRTDNAKIGLICFFLDFFEFNSLFLIIFSKFNEINIERPEKFGGNVKYSDYKELENDFKERKIHPGDLKQTIGNYLVEIISPIREKLNLSEELSEAIKKSF